ncbi:MAG: FtsW/RodA/SpoVE family cell cycle protein [bacterium]
MIRTGPFVVGALFVLTLGLVMLGIIMVLSASQFVFSSANPDRNMYQYMGKQLISFSLGLACLGFCSTRDYNRWDRWSRALMVLAIGLLVFVLFFGPKVNGARRWIVVFGLQFQPSEFTKLAVILYLSSVWAGRYERLGSFFKGVMFPMSLVVTALGLILLEPSHSATLFIGVLSVSIWYVAGGRIRHVIPFFAALCVAVLVALYQKPYLLERIYAFFQPGAYKDKSFHVEQAEIGFAHGGMWGVGLGEGQQTLGFIPFVHTDFIFAAMGEELGFVKCSLVLLIFLAIVWLGFTIALRCQNPFGRLLATGCTAALGMQSAINIAVVTGCLPTTGISLPFISYGGSSLCVSMAMIGLLMSVAKETFDANQVRSRG